MSEIDDDQRRMFLMDIWDAHLLDKIFPESREQLQEALGTCISTCPLPYLCQESGNTASATEKKVEEVDEAPSRTRRRNTTLRSASADDLFSQLSNHQMFGMYDMVAPYKYGDPNGVAPHDSQPYRVIVHPLVNTLCEIHSCLCDSEVIGMLAGKWDAAQKIMYVQIAIPCGAMIMQDGGATDVEIDPVAQISANVAIDSLGLQLLGWYHSHPKFLPNPSIIDIRNQYAYQTKFEEDKMPFVGLIISISDSDCTNNESIHQWFIVKKYMGKYSTARDDVAMPLHIHAETLPITIDSSASVPNNLDKLKAGDSARKASHAATKKLSSRIVDGVKKEKAEEVADNTKQSKDAAPVSLKRKYSDKEKPVAEEVPVISHTPPSALITVVTSDSLGFASEGGRPRRQRNTQRLDEAISSLNATESSFTKKIVEEMNKIDEKKKTDIKVLDTGKSNMTKTSKEEKKVPSDKKKEIVKEVAPQPSSTKNVIKEGISEADRIYISLEATLLHSALISSQLGRKLITETIPALQLFTLTIINLGIYYSRHKHRLDLLASWKGKSLMKMDKLMQKAQRWLQLLHVKDHPQYLQQYLNNITAFLQQCWFDYSANTGKISARKRPRES